MNRFLFAGSAVLALLLASTSTALARAKPADLPAQNQINCPDGSDDPVGRPRLSIEVGLDLVSKSLTVKIGLTKPATPANIDAVTPAVISAYLQQLVRQIAESVDAAKKRNAETAEKTRSLEVRLFDPVKIRIEQVPLKTAIKNLAYVSKLPIAIDYKSLRNAGIDLDAPVTLKLENVSAHKALGQFLADLDLEYVIQNGVVLVTTRGCRKGPLSDVEELAKANDRLAQRLFEAGDKCRRDGDYSRARICFQQVHLLTPTTIIGRVAIARIMEIEERMRVDAEEQGLPGRESPQEAFQRMRENTVPLGTVRVEE